MTRGMQSSEFWLSLIAMALSMVKNQFVPDLPDEAIYIVIAYVLGRSVFKAAEAYSGGAVDVPIVWDNGDDEDE